MRFNYFFNKTILIQLIFLLILSCESKVHVDQINSESRNSFSLETLSDGSGSQVQNYNLEAGETFTIFSIERNSKQDYLQNTEGNWTLSGSIGSLSISPDGKSITFTANSVGSGEISFSSNGQSVSISITVIPGGLQFISEPTSTTILTSINPNVSVQALDSQGNPDNDFNGDITIDIETDGASGSQLLGNTTQTAINGIAIFSNLSLDEEGSNFTLRASAENKSNTTSATFDITGTGAAIIYRSLGPSSTTALVSGGANQMDIDNGVATFSSPLPDNIGLGDIIQFDSDGNATIDSLAVIHGRTSSQIFKVKTTLGNTLPPNITSTGSWSICRAYTKLVDTSTLSENVACLEDTLEDFDTSQDLTSGVGKIWNLVAYGDAIDLGGRIEGWTTSASNYLRVFTPYASSQVGTSQRHNGKWLDNPNAFHISRAAGGGGSNGSAITIVSPNVKIDGLQIEKNGTDGTDDHPCGIRVLNGTAGDVEITNNLIKGSPANTEDWHQGILFWGGNSGTTTIVNNIIFDFIGSSTGNNGIAFCRADVAGIYNNTFYNNVRGIQNDCGSGANITLINNLVQATGSAGFGPGPWEASTSNNLSSHADAPGADSLDSITVLFIDPVQYDFTIDPSDTTNLNKGLDLSSGGSFPFEFDINNQYRNANSFWDIGAIDSN